ncbi:hypothetical protein [Sneathiella sp.]|uniref:hypothetical protein n=1 Tax=Sneathiella sp. TaxID=1964365 RepID=UPI00356514D5
MTHILTTPDILNSRETRLPGRLKYVAAGLLLALALTATGCSSDGDEAADTAEYPKLSSVPDKPADVATLREAREIADELRADRANARYTDELLRADTSVQPMPSN